MQLLCGDMFLFSFIKATRCFSKELDFRLKQASSSVLQNYSPHNYFPVIYHGLQCTDYVASTDFANPQLLQTPPAAHNKHSC